MVAMKLSRRHVPMLAVMTLSLLPICGAAALLQALLLRAHLLAPATSDHLLILWAPLLLPALGAPLAVTWVTRRRLQRFSAVLRRIGQGDLGARLPEPPSRELASVAETVTDMAQALERAMNQLREVDQQRRRLFADLAHELATPAGAILGIADTLAEPALCPPGPEGDALRARLLKALAEEAQRLGALTRDLGELAHLEDPQIALRPVPDDLAAVAARVVERMNAAGGAPIITLRAAPAPVTIDPGRIEQVLVNLLGNARRYSPAGASVEVQVAPLPGGGAEVSVRDHGPGVPEALLPRLGERLFRQDPSRDRRTGGHGLGLALARQIVLRHQGALHFQNAPDGGLLAQVRLPAG
jgi:signal transduction histidine kinase